MDQGTTKQFTPEMHRFLGIEFFNKVWEYLDKTNRDEHDNEMMLHTAHASLLHWMLSGGTQENIYIGHWQISRVYAVLNRFEPALHHAEIALKICRDNGFTLFNLAYAFEGLARAYRVNADIAKMEEFRTLAYDEMTRMTDDESIAMLKGDLETIRI